MVTTVTDGWLGWHFTDHTEMLRFGDGRKVVVGERLTIDGEPILYQRGLHAATTVLDALTYAPGPILHRVKLSGKIVRRSGRACATERTSLAKIDATDLLWRFARKCALNVIHLWDAPQVVRDYLETGDEKLRGAAHAATRRATKDAAWDAEGLPARNAARAAEGAAVSAPAWDAAWDAARYAADAAARTAAWSTYCQILDDMVRAAMPEVP